MAQSPPISSPIPSSPAADAAAERAPSASSGESEARSQPDRAIRDPSEVLERRNAALEKTLRSLAHDLRSPLVSVLGFARLLRDEQAEGLGRTGLHFVDRIEQAGRQMQSLLDDLLELSRIADAPQFPVHVNPVHVLEQVAGEFKIRLEEADIQLQWPEDPPVIICDRTRLYQIFSNLVGNAIRHMNRPSGGRIDIEIESSQEGWQIEVRDNGVGIGAEDRDRIFDAFERGAKGSHEATATIGQGQSPGSQTQSTGLGLAIVREIVEAHRGRVWVESEPGQGARFLVFLPKSG